MASLISITALDNSHLSRHLFDDGSYIDMQVVPKIEPTVEEIAADAKAWRDSELQATDFVVPLADHPERSAYLTYRNALRDWPSTSDFPAKKPVLGV
jgi:hypothetical protein